jgi:TatD DNase family protein
MLIDSHCHLDFPTLSSRLPEILTSAANCGVLHFIVPGVEPQSWDKIISLAAADNRIFAAPGVHPMHADKWSPAAAATLEKLIPDIVAIGEIGLDYSEGMPPPELQQEVFRAQLRLAREAELPVIIHCRRAFADTLRILSEKKADRVAGVMHAFSGSVEVARDCIAMGLKIGIAGPVTWDNAIRPVKLVEAIPLEHLLLETDSPDLSPQSHRGEVNEPAFLLDIARKVAEINGLSFDEIAAVTSENAQALFLAERINRKKNQLCRLNWIE